MGQHKAPYTVLATVCMRTAIQVPEDASDPRFYNSHVLVSSSGDIAGVYHKLVGGAVPAAGIARRR